MDACINEPELKLSIITASCNSEKYIEDAIKSVLMQTYRNIEHIIIDGGSTDRTLDIINKYSRNLGFVSS
ncbi:MAG: glycosyltransferase [Gracilibacteraceae bacterium]|nr:glycosyltransferase [Gracilibacteraceae bacterium]